MELALSVGDIIVVRKVSFLYLRFYLSHHLDGINLVISISVTGSCIRNHNHFSSRCGIIKASQTPPT